MRAVSSEEFDRQERRAKVAVILCAVWAVLSFLLLPGCGTVPPTPTPVYSCATYCAHAVDMGCDFAQNTPAGTGCVAVCENVQAKLVKWDLACRSTAETCARIDACERK